MLGAHCWLFRQKGSHREERKSQFIQMKRKHVWSDTLFTALLAQTSVELQNELQDLKYTPNRGDEIERWYMSDVNTRSRRVR